MNVDIELRRIATRAHRRALVMVIVGTAVAATCALYVSLLATVLDGRFFMVWFIPMAGLGLIPLVIGLPIAIAGAVRLRVLSRVMRTPRDVVAAELAHRFGRPAARLFLSDGSWVVVVADDIDGTWLDQAIRART